MKKSLFIIFLVIFLDQIIKFYVKTHMYLGQEYHVLGNWFIIHFTENNGMAFGYELQWQYGKIFLSVFRIIAVIGIAWILLGAIRKQAHFGLVAGGSLVFAGALGNIIDSAFYGLLFSESDYEIAQFIPPDGGYSGFLHGKVVDMFYFPILEGHFPDWFPIWGSEEFIFFRPVFNLSDSAITVGVCMIILFQSEYFIKTKNESGLTQEPANDIIVEEKNLHS